MGPGSEQNYRIDISALFCMVRCGYENKDNAVGDNIWCWIMGGVTLFFH